MYFSGKHKENTMVIAGKDESLLDKSIKFVDFPNELLLNILGFLEIVNLIKFSQTSKRIRVLCYEKSLWQKINLSKKRVTSEFLQKVINYGCKWLNLNEAKLIGTLRLENKSQLNHLDLSGCRAENQSVFEELFKSCHSLQTLSFTQEVDISQVTAQNGKTLQILNCLSEFGRILDLSYIKCIFKNCSELKELHFWNGVNIIGNYCYLCVIKNVAGDYLVNNISTEIEKFSFGYGQDLGGKEIKTLVSRCTKLKELRLMANTDIINDSVTHIINHLKPTLEKLVLDEWRSSRNDFRNLYQLKSMPKLKKLDFTFTTQDKSVISELRNQLPDVSVNGYPPMSKLVKPEICCTKFSLT